VSGRPDCRMEGLTDELLARILDAHGGLDRWSGYEKVQATLEAEAASFSRSEKDDLRVKASGDPDQPKGAA
jgi:hypothetical protein